VAIISWVFTVVFAILHTKVSYILKKTRMFGLGGCEVFREEESKDTDAPCQWFEVCPKKKWKASPGTALALTSAPTISMSISDD
jgi:hypothetical protein